MWTCPRCDRRFGVAGRAHVCAPGMAIDEYFADRAPLDREIFDAVAAVLADCEGVEVEAVSVGVLFRARRTFVELRPRRVGLALSIVLSRELTSARVSRRVPLDE